MDKNDGTNSPTHVYEKFGVGFYGSQNDAENEPNAITLVPVPEYANHVFRGYYNGTKQIFTATGELATGITSEEFKANATLTAEWLLACPSEYPNPTTWVEDLADCYKTGSQVCPCVSNAESCSFAGATADAPQSCKRYNNGVDLCVFDEPANCEITDVVCNSGYTQSGNACTTCPAGYYCQDSDDTPEPCPPDIPTSPIGSKSENDCGRLLHIGDYTMFLHKGRPTPGPVLAIKVGEGENGTLYTNLSTDGKVMTNGGQAKLHVTTATGDYTAFDNSVFYYGEE